MKKIILTVFVLSLLVVFTNCKKWDKIEDENTVESTNLNEGNFSPTFDWETAKNITINVTSADSQIITITSEDGNIRYYRAKHPGQNETFKVCLNVPVGIDELILNNRNMSIASNPVTINLND